ncbi:MAG: MlaD family protein [Alphaproteobacteria bacterium]|nr:MlaD family protein [Alphaproteobacteria bacterium]
MAETYSKEESRYIKVGLWVSFALILLLIYFTTQKSAVVYSQDSGDYVLTAKFGRTDGLLIGDKVLMSGIEIGKVLSSKLDENYHSIITLSIDNIAQIPLDSSASIASMSLLGNKFISIEPGGDEEFMVNNDQFSYTQDSMVIDELVERIVEIGKSHCGTK